MKRKLLIAFALTIICGLSGAATAQSGLGHLKSWAGKYPTYKKGRVTRSFFALPEIRQPLMKLLRQSDYNLLTREYTVETPIKLLGDYLAVKVCRPHNCGEGTGGFAVNLKTGFIFVRLKNGDVVRWYGSNADDAELPREVHDYLDVFSAT